MSAPAITLCRPSAKISATVVAKAGPGELAGGDVHADFVGRAAAQFGPPPCHLTWTNMVRMLAADVLGENRGLTQNPLLAEPLQEMLLLGLLLTSDHPYRDRLASPRLASPRRPRAIRQAIDLLHSHPEQPITIAKLADVTGVSERALQAGFQRYAGITPITYLRQVRLDRVHEELRQADPAQTTVAAVAHRWGFTHLGRFAGYYRARHGESPSEHSTPPWAHERYATHRDNSHERGRCRPGRHMAPGSG
ncbi:hypothetical protein Ari01nite_82900 [Paractinoplanes rishiriensis]|uniref:HTH araC/xylS-type domain-containing protein n=1 Tax=Paractinoplanes rishiriensis TaxID=1050105 RepID=A0A919K8I7_9ACTN|nr:hypothetical protein Ari01nite_82900 [Actinoplanes rishiriensis]